MDLQRDFINALYVEFVNEYWHNIFQHIGYGLPEIIPFPVLFPINRVAGNAQWKKPGSVSQYEYLESYVKSKFYHYLL